VSLSVVLISLLLINLIFIYYWSKKHGYILNLGSFFNILSIVYLVTGVFVYDIIQEGFYTSQLLTISTLSIIAVIAFNFGYMTFSKSFKGVNFYNIRLPSDKVIFLIAIIGILANLYLVFSSEGFNFFSMTRTDRFKYLSQHSNVVYLGSMLVVVYIHFSIKFVLLKIHSAKKYFYLFLGYFILWGFLTISRNDFLIVFLVLASVLQLSGKLKNISTIWYGLLFLMFIIFYKGIMYIYFLDNFTHEGLNFGEIVNWIRNTIIVIDDSPVQFEHFSYWTTIKGIVMPFVSEYEPLSNWFMSTYYPGQYSDGNKYGFTGVAEGYIMGSWIFTFIHFFITGVLMSYFSINNTWIKIFLSIASMLILYKLFRSESYNFYRTLFWYSIYPLLIIQTVSIILTRQRKSI
jgi:hypothetical protein